MGATKQLGSNTVRRAFGFVNCTAGKGQRRQGQDGQLKLQFIQDFLWVLETSV